MSMRIASIAFVAALAAGPAAAQMIPPTNNPGLLRQRQPYDVTSFGMFRMLILEGDFSPKVNVGTVMAERPTTGMGALSEARGEITIYDGKLIISYGKPASHPAPEDERAALLSVSTARAWQTVMVDHDVAPDDIDTFLAQTAAAHGIGSEGPFPFQVRGTLASYVMHVNAEPTTGPHGMGQPIAINVESRGDAIEGAVAGLYASRDLVGIVTHGGTRNHSHWIAADGGATAHLDRWGLKSGAILSLPKP